MCRLCVAQGWGTPPPLVQLGPFTAVSCSITLAHTAMLCYTPPGFGGPHVWSIQIAGQPGVPFSSTPTYFRLPTITKLSGTLMLNTSGG